MMARLKVMGRCTDYAGELVQEGRFALNGSTAGGEARFSIMPTLRGEKAVVRLLDGGEELRRLDRLGFHQPLIEALRAAMDQPQGLLLAVGPSGCGKSTTLYALLHDLHIRSGRPVSILTIEDPIERSLPFAAQITADHAHGLGFGRCLRAVLRQDPEVIMIGEIRDMETAEAALQAALTGHRLLSSMHTTTAAEALVRLQQMGAAPYVVASALAGVLNVRLVKLLCPHCKRPRALTPNDWTQIPEYEKWTDRQIAEPAGCDQCLRSGHSGRSAVAEWLAPTQETMDALQQHASVSQLAPTLARVVPAKDVAIDLMCRQLISPAEFHRLVGSLRTA
jgi:MSHA biogenesis protein MshE